MTRSKQARSRSRRRDSFQARIELLEDRLPLGTILALAGSALSDLSYGRLNARMPFVGSERDPERASAGLSQTAAPPILTILPSTRVTWRW